eukprot:3988149-Heterocapsa_arctica.AAC.1
MLAGVFGGPGVPVLCAQDLKKKIMADVEAKKKDGALLNYCMKYKVLGYPLPEPKLRVICFHCAGSAESIYTGGCAWVV